MKLFVAIMSFVVLFMACRNSRQSPAGKDALTETEVLDFINHYDQSWGARDTSRMKELMDDHYIYFTSTGKTSNRKAIIGWFTPADKYKVDTAVRSEITVMRLKDNTAIVSSRWTGSGTFGEEKFNDDQRCGLVIQKTGGKLKLISEHCTQIVK